MKIADNGRGIADNELEQAVRQNRLGIYGMKERAELLNGTFQMLSSSLIGGTTIIVTIPFVEK
jgi:signal transduction histidine kinase